MYILYRPNNPIIALIELFYFFNVKLFIRKSFELLLIDLLKFLKLELK